MKDLININNELSSLLKIFIEQIAEKDSFEVSAWLKENDIKLLTIFVLYRTMHAELFSYLESNGWKTAMKITGKQESLPKKTSERLMLSFQRFLEL